MNKPNLLTLSFIIIVTIIIGVFFLSISEYYKRDKISLNEYFYTKAICNETNYCQDYEIVCKENKLIRLNLITGASIQHSLNWKDPRDEKTKNGLC